MTANGNYVTETDIDNWSDEASESQKQSVINRCEDLIERVTKDYFYAKSFDIAMDGNGKNKLFPNLMSDILSIASIKLSEVLLNSNLYAFDKDCIFRAALATAQCKAIEGITLPGTNPVKVNITSHGFITGELVRLVLITGISPSLDGEYVVTKVDNDNFTLNGTDSSDYTGTFVSGTACFASLAELHYLTGAEDGLFPKGTCNVKITGTMGWISCPAAIKQVAIILCRYENDETLYTKYDDITSDSLGDASYSRGDKKYLTGIHEADRLLRNCIRKKPTLGIA